MVAGCKDVLLVARNLDALAGGVEAEVLQQLQPPPTKTRQTKFCGGIGHMAYRFRQLIPQGRWHSFGCSKAASAALFRDKVDKLFFKENTA